MPVNLDPIQTGGVLRLALEGKLKKDSNPLLIADSNPTVLLDGFSSLTEDIQVRRKKIRYSSSVAAGTRLPVLPPRPSLHHVPRPSLHFYNSSWLPKEIDKLLKVKEIFSVPKFKFTICDDSANFNYELLQNEGFNLEKLLNPDRISST